MRSKQEACGVPSLANNSSCACTPWVNTRGRTIKQRGPFCCPQSDPEEIRVPLSILLILVDTKNKSTVYFIGICRGISRSLAGRDPTSSILTTAARSHPSRSYITAGSERKEGRHNMSEAARTMKAWRKHHDSTQAFYEKVPIPDCPATGYLVKVLAAGVCHSDYGLLQRLQKPPRYNDQYTLGHEGCGEILRTGDQVDSAEFKVGDRVVVNIAPGCAEADCPACGENLAQLCQRARQYGLGTDGSLAPYIAVDNARSLVHLPEGQRFCVKSPMNLGTEQSADEYDIRDKSGDRSSVLGCNHDRVSWHRAESSRQERRADFHFRTRRPRFQRYSDRTRAGCASPRF
nr:l-threonine 3-dehydrogenase [Quercus suber]